MGKVEALFSATHGLAWFVVCLFGALFGFGSSGPAAAVCGGSPVLATDKPDYGPTETVVISGTGFNCGEAVSVLVTAPDGSTRSADGTGADGPDIVVTDDNGALSLSYYLSGTLADGRAYEGQLGMYRVEVRDRHGTVLAGTIFSDTNSDFSCALTIAGGVKCWGLNSSGQLGDGSFADSATPVDVTGLTSGVTQITLGLEHACALTNTGSAKCWGSNEDGQLGNGTFPTVPPYGISMPVDVSGMDSGVAQITAGFAHTCALTVDGGAKCWGNNLEGALGNGTLTSDPPYGFATPVDVSGMGSGVAQISAGSHHTCALTVNGGVKCWGNTYIDTPGNIHATPVDVAGLTSGVAQINAGSYHDCVVTIAGRVKCWGENSSGQLGNGTFTASSTPVDVSTLTSRVIQISGGQEHTCALIADGGAKCWGVNDNAQLGNGTLTSDPPYGIATPVDVSGMSSGVAQISTGAIHTCALLTNGGAKCWGLNRVGALGDGTFTTSATPVDVSGLMSGVAALWDAEPIALSWTFSGFYHPVEMGGAWNTVKGGSTVPIKFQVFAGATELTDSSIVVQPLTATQTACTGGPTETLELMATGKTGLRYDTDGGHFIYNWKTPKKPGYCYTITVALTNGASLSANLELR